MIIFLKAITAEGETQNSFTAFHGLAGAPAGWRGGLWRQMRMANGLQMGHGLYSLLYNGLQWLLTLINKAVYRGC